MENDFPFEQLSPRAFEQLAVALAETVIGAGLEVYGPGPDGGREATWDGTINWSRSGFEAKDVWRGYTVIQAKLCQYPSEQSTTTNYKWLLTQIQNELASWIDSDSKRSRFPNYLLIVTNVRLTAADPGGTMQLLDAAISNILDPPVRRGEKTKSVYRQKGLRQIKIWHRYKLNNLLSYNVAVRQQFRPLIALGDILACLGLLPGEVPAEHILSVFIKHAKSAIQSGRWIRFDDAGDEQRKHAIDKVFVDLPVECDAEHSRITRECLRRGDRSLRYSLWQAFRNDPSEPARHLVVTGAAGNGKSTVTRYLAQTYRAAFLAREHNSSRSVTEIISDSTESLTRIDTSPPLVARWPIRVEIAAMAERMGPGDGGPSIYRYLCDVLSERAEVQVQPTTLQAWLARWPAVLIFDGLDEVSEFASRQRVIAEITQLVTDADEADADVFVIVTTRPTGYTERLLPDNFDQIDLTNFEPLAAKKYGHHITAKRLEFDDPDYRNLVLKNFDDAVQDANVERILRTPLQVLILTIIVEHAGLLPTNRYRLFWNYFDTIFKREAKKAEFRSLLNTYRDEIEDLHRHVGLLLHRRCENSSDVDARLPLDELREIAFDRLREDQHSIPKANEIADKIVSVATQRLVLLSADKDDTVSFDVRSLQELMAGRALVSGPERDYRHNLILTSRSPHWRNAWLFAAGELFTGGNYEREVVLEIVEACDQEPAWPNWLCPIGPVLAADILDDGLAANKPIFVKRLVAVALQALTGPMPSEVKNLGKGLVAAASDAEQQTVIHHALRKALSGDPRQRAIASSILHYGTLGADTEDSDSLIVPAGMQQNYYGNMWVYRSASADTRNFVSVADLLRSAMSRAQGEKAVIPHQLQNALAECAHLFLIEATDGELTPVAGTEERFEATPVLEACLNDSNASSLRSGMELLDANQWRAASLLSQACGAKLTRTPVGAAVRTFHAPNLPNNPR